MYNRILFSLKWKEIPTQATTWMNPEVIIPNDLSQSQKDKYCNAVRFTERKNRMVVSRE